MSFLTQPLYWVGGIVLAGAALSFKRRWPGAIVSACGVALALVMGWTALPDTLLKNLEERYERPAGKLDGYAGVIVLGGALQAPHPVRVRGSGALSNLNERMTESARLLQDHRNFRLIFTGREEEVAQPDGSAVSRPKLLFSALHADVSRIVFEEAARDTYENAVFTARLLGAQRDEHWLLVTSARHMPRALGSFRAAGVNVDAYPVDYVIDDQIDWRQYSLVEGVRRWQFVLKEYVGGFIYFVTGRSAAFV